MSENIKELGKTILSNGIASLAVEAVGLSNMIPAPNSEFGTYTRIGVSNAVAQDITNFYINNKPSNILNMNYYEFVDDAFFNGALAFGAVKTGASQKLFELGDSILPFDEKIRNAVVNGGIITAGNSIADYIDTYYGSDSMIGMLTHVTRNIRGTYTGGY